MIQSDACPTSFKVGRSWGSAFAPKGLREGLSVGVGIMNTFNYAMAYDEAQSKKEVKG